MAGRRVVTRGNRPNYDWEGVSTTALSLVSAGTTQAEIGIADSAETLVRVRGEFCGFLKESGSTSGDACTVAAGLIVAPTGATVAVDPVTEPGANWLWHSWNVLATEGIIGGVSEHGAGLLTAFRVPIDNKAMRKLREDESVFFVVTNQNINGSPLISVIATLRLLTQR